MTFGCDPEVFILDEYGAPVSPEDFLPGTKEEPYKVNKGAVQVDGMAGEFNIDPAHTFDEFDDNIVSVMKEMTGMLPKGYKLSVVPHMVRSEEHTSELQSLMRISYAVFCLKKQNTNQISKLHTTYRTDNYTQTTH